MARRRPEQPLHPAWQAFLSRHQGHPFLTHDPLYALGENVLNALVEHWPCFLSPEQEDFERDLCRTTQHGCFLRRPITELGSDLFTPPTPETDQPRAPLAGEGHHLRR